MSSVQIYQGQRFNASLNRKATEQLKQIAEGMKETNLLHTLNLIIEKTHKEMQK